LPSLSKFIRNGLVYCKQAIRDYKIDIDTHYGIFVWVDTGPKCLWIVDTGPCAIFQWLWFCFDDAWPCAFWWLVWLFAGTLWWLVWRFAGSLWWIIRKYIRHTYSGASTFVWIWWYFFIITVWSTSSSYSTTTTATATINDDYIQYTVRVVAV
jgi:hypothetical protein